MTVSVPHDVVDLTSVSGINIYIIIMTPAK